MPFDLNQIHTAEDFLAHAQEILTFFNEASVAGAPEGRAIFYGGTTPVSGVLGPDGTPAALWRIVNAATLQNPVDPGSQTPHGDLFQIQNTEAGSLLYNFLKRLKDEGAEPTPGSPLYDSYAALTTQLWNTISFSFTQSVSGAVRVLLGGDYADDIYGAVLYNVEIPALLQNENVTTINGIDRKLLVDLYNATSNYDKVISLLQGSTQKVLNKIGAGTLNDVINEGLDDFGSVMDEASKLANQAADFKFNRMALRYLSIAAGLIGSAGALVPSPADAAIAASHITIGYIKDGPEGAYNETWDQAQGFAIGLGILGATAGITIALAYVGLPVVKSGPCWINGSGVR